MAFYKRLDSEIVLKKHHGIFRGDLTLWEATALLVPIGAGVLGIPYAVAQVGLIVGLFYIVILGFLMMGMNLLVGEVLVRTKGEKQLVGLAKKYLGNGGEVLMSLISYLMLFGALVVYIIGVGESLAVLFRGGAFFWSIVFSIIGSVLIFVGLRTIKKVELFLILSVLLVVFVIAIFSAPHVVVEHVRYTNFASLLFPYGVILFAFHGTTSVPEAHSLLLHKPELFKKALIYSILVGILIYIIFASVVVGVTGLNTTQIATIGLGNAVGPVMVWVGNLFAVLAMGSSFLMVGVALRDSFVWDLKFPKGIASAFVCGVPIIIFLLGLRQFIAAVDIVGGVFGSIELLLLLLIYWRAKSLGDLPTGKYSLHHTALLAALLFLAFSVGAAYSVVKLF